MEAITIIDYQLGNPGSILNMLKKIGVSSMISSNVDAILNAKRLILPGVGSFDAGMDKLNQLDLIPALNVAVLKKQTPILGICLGMQLMCKNSEEGKKDGLAWFDAAVKKFNFPATYSHAKIPHMGWNELLLESPNLLLDNFVETPRFYFVHSYHVVCEQNTDVVAQAFYHYPFTAAIAKQNIYGVQFHPEKSHKFGMQLLRNFANTPSAD